ncbi:MAG: hypothetical protein ACREK3_10605 [Gemmatimonadota bacterium]
MRAMEIGLMGVLVAMIAAAPLDAYAQGHGKARGHDKDADGPPGQVKKQNGDDHDQVIIIDDDDDDDGDDGRIVIRGDSRDDRRDGRQDGQIILRDGDGRVIVIDDDRIDRRFPANRGRGPAFCRSGAGHPVWGRSWCLEKGFGLGDRNDVFFDDGRVIFWDDDTPVIVRDSRFRDDRGFWEEAVDRILFWAE